MSAKANSSEFERRRAKALAMGGEEKLAQRKAQGLLNARERIARLLDEGSFLESGLFAFSSGNPEDRDSTPADGKLAGYGRIDGREVALVANDFTVKGASSSLSNGKKIAHMKRTATQRGIPLVMLGESSGARMPDTMGARGMGSMLGGDPTQYQRMRETPWAAAALGNCFGSSAWYCVLADFNVFRKGAILAVSSPRLCSLAINEQVDSEELGGWRVHAEVTGFADLVVDTDEEAMDAIRRFLSYLPSHHNEAPPVSSVPKGSDEAAAALPKVLPESRTQVYDVRKVVRAVVDQDSLFELRARFGKVGMTALARLGGRTVGIVANNPMFKGGALDGDGCDKITSFLVLCDSFNVPIIMFVDTPGFFIGLDVERKRAAGKIMNFMNALSLCTVPRLSVVLRKSYGQAYLNMGGGRNSDEVAAWPSAEISFMDPMFAVHVVHGSRDEKYRDPSTPEFQREFEQMRGDAEVWDIAGNYSVQHVIPPEDTRAYLLRMLEVHQLRLSGGVGQHLMRTWPTSY
ncbi:MAG: methylmalonyl-CoA carboxyltransferase [SAR324 cluster bacterium]|nr:methylmalonyl-CoA carboxyltransferase [SAR324 cluster bacterium]